jgi:hypothetical protein
VISEMDDGRWTKQQDPVVLDHIRSKETHGHKFPSLGFLGFHIFPKATKARIARRTNLASEIDYFRRISLAGYTPDTECHGLSFIGLKCGFVVVKGM